MAQSEADSEVVLLTGATSGIGNIAARRLAKRGLSVIGVGRDEQAGQQLEDTATDLDGTIEFHRVDLSRFSDVRGLAETVRTSHGQLDVLVNNAGLSAGDWNKTPAGIELTMAVNHLAPYLLTHELIDLIIDSNGRIVTTASEAHRRGSLNDNDLWFEEAYDALDAYASSKLANIAFTLELAKRLPDGPVANCFHPGFIPSTDLFREAPRHIRLTINLASVVPFVGEDEEEGARRLLTLATAPEYGRKSGQYIGGDGPMSPDHQATDADTRRRLWQASAEVLGIDPDWP